MRYHPEEEEIYRKGREERTQNWTGSGAALLIPRCLCDVLGNSMATSGLTDIYTPNACDTVKYYITLRMGIRNLKI